MSERQVAFVVLLLIGVALVHLCVQSRGSAVVLAVLLTLSSTALGQSGGSATVIQAPVKGSVCLLSITDPTPGEKSLYNYAGGNPPPDYSVQIGNGSIVALPHSPKGAGAGVLITGIPGAKITPWVTP